MHIIDYFARLWSLLFGPAPKQTQRPGYLTIVGIEQRRSNMIDLLVYKLTLLPVPEGDILFQRLLITELGSGDEQSMVLDIDVLEHEFSVVQDEDVRIELFYGDDAEIINWSAPSMLEFKAIDTIAPEAPAGFGGIDLIGEDFILEVPEEPVLSEPVVEEPVAEEPANEDLN
jgi:hypothetical protein